MSRLYDVIKRLEKAAEQDSTLARTTGSRHDTTDIAAFKQASLREKRSPLIRVLLLAALAITPGVIALAAVFWWKTAALQPAAQDMPDTSLPPRHPAPAVPAAVSAPLPAVLSRKKLQEIDPPAETAVIREVAETAQPRNRGPETRTEGSSQDKQQIQQRQDDTKGKEQEQELKKKQSGTPSAASVTTTDIPADINRWLQQAEACRHRGDWNNAIPLYKKIFNITRDPAVANNLAAALIETRRLREALNILEEARIMAPHDHDIEQNLNVIRQALKDTGEEVKR